MRFVIGQSDYFGFGLLYSKSALNRVFVRRKPKSSLMFYSFDVLTAFTFWQNTGQGSDFLNAQNSVTCYMYDVHL